MSDREMLRVSAKTAAEVCGLFAPGETAQGLLAKEMTPKQYLDLLIEKQEFPDAARFLASALPKREAVWWACLCAQQAAGANPAPPIVAALGAAEAWVAEPIEANRRAAHTAAEAAGYGTAAGSAAAAAFWSGGSLGPPDIAPIPPGEQLSAHGAACAVMLAAVASEPEKAPEKYRGFFRVGFEVAQGARPWPEPASKASPARPEVTSQIPRQPQPKTTRPTLNWE